MARSQKKADQGHVLTNLFNAELGEPINLIIRNTCANRDMCDLIRNPKSRREQMSFQNGKETINVPHYGAGKQGLSASVCSIT